MKDKKSKSNQVTAVSSSFVLDDEARKTYKELQPRKLKKDTANTISVFKSNKFYSS